MSAGGTRNPGSGPMPGGSGQMSLGQFLAQRFIDNGPRQNSGLPLSQIATQLNANPPPMSGGMQSMPLGGSMMGGNMGNMMGGGGYSPMPMQQMQSTMQNMAAQQAQQMQYPMSQPVQSLGNINASGGIPKISGKGGTGMQSSPQSVNIDLNKFAQGGIINLLAQRDSGER